MRRGESGFTLIELVLCVAIGAALVFGIVLFTRTQLEQSVKSSDFLTALNLAKGKMAELDALPFSSVPANGTTTDYADTVIGGFIMRLAVTQIASGGAGGNLRTLNQLDLKVDYAGGDYTKPLVRLIAYRQNGTSFGNGT